MAASLLRIGRLGCHKCLQAGSWSTLSRAPVAVAFTTKSGGSKKSSQKRTFDKKQAKTYFDIEKLVQHKLCEVSPATAAETTAAAAAKPTAQPMPSGSSSESVAITSAVETGGIVVEASFSPQSVSDPASAAEATPVVEVPPAVEALFESATTAGAVPVVEAPAESATVVAAVPIVEAVAETAAATPTEDFAVATVTATETTASVGKEPDEVARLPATDAGAALVVEAAPEVVLVEATPIDVATVEPVAEAAPVEAPPEPVAEAAPVEAPPKPVAEAAPVEAAPEPVAEVAPFVAATAAVLVEATPVDVATLEPVAEAATVHASLEPEAKAVMGPVAEPVAEAAPVEVAKAAPLEVAPEPVAEAAPVEAAPEPMEAPYTPLERAEELVDHSPVLTKATGEELQEEIPAEPAEPSEAHMDPIQKLFLESIRKYSSRSQATGGLVDAGSDYEKALAEEIAKLQRFYGGGDLTSFPEFKFAEPKLDEVSQE